MEKQLIAKINGTDIFAEETEDGIFVPIKPICTAIGIDFAAQYNKIKSDEFLSPVIAIIATTGVDGKTYEMVVLPLKYVYGWLATINPGKVNSESKELVIKYRKECYDVLYNHFTGRIQKANQLNKAEIDLLEKLRTKLEEKKEIGNEIKNIEKSLEELRKDRLDTTPSLFD